MLRQKEEGAKALFGEKYGEFIRMITFDKHFSRELCGGTHVQNTSELGYFKIVSETAVAAGIRRIEAKTRASAYDYVDTELGLLSELRTMLKNPKDPVETVKKMIEEKNQLQKQIALLQKQHLVQLKKSLLEAMVVQHDREAIISKVELEGMDQLRELVYLLQEQKNNRLVFLANKDAEGKAQLALMLSKKHLEEDKIDANKIIKRLSKHIQGGGGGQAFFATAGGKNAEGIQNALKELKDLLKHLLT